MSKDLTKVTCLVVAIIEAGVQALGFGANLLPALSHEMTDTKERGYCQDPCVAFLLTLQ